MSDNVLFNAPDETLVFPKQNIFIIDIGYKKDLRNLNRSLKKYKEKSKYNESYHEELISIESMKQKHNYRNFGLY